ncbi:MAG: DNA primase [Pseudomonadales bacterium]
MTAHFFMPGRIPQEFIDQLLDRVDIVDVIDSRVSLRKSGRNFMACCPFHDEKTPSFSVQPEKQFYHCFGCGAGGNAIGFLMEYERLEFPVAVEQLAAKCGLEVPRETIEQREQTEKKHNLYDALTQTDRFYRRQLRDHKQATKAVAYLKERGLSGDIAAQFGVGYAPPGWESLLSEVKTDNDKVELLLQSGMLVSRDENRVYDFFRDRIMFPIRDSRGRTIAFGGRVLGNEKPKYLNSPESPIFHKGRELYGLFEARQANKHLSKVVVVEGYMDVIALAQQGINYAVATLGTATSSIHLQQLFRHCPEIVFCFDGDAAGLKAARRALDTVLPLMEDGRQVRFLLLPAGEDPDTLVRSQGAEQFEQRVSNATPLSEYIFDAVSEDVDTSTADGKARLSQLALQFVQKLPDGAFRVLMLAELGQRTGLTVDTVTRLAEQDIEPPIEEPTLSAEPLQRPARRSNTPETFSLAESAISMLLYRPQLASQVPDLSVLEQLPDADIQLLTELLKLLHRRPESSTGVLLGYWYGKPEGEKLSGLCGRGIELLREGVDILERAGGDKVEFDAGIEQQFLDTVEKIKGLHSEARIRQLLLVARESQLDEQQSAELAQLLNGRKK